MKGITVITRESHRNRLASVEIKDDIDVAIRTVKTIEKDGKIYEYKMCTKIITCEHIMLIRHSMTGQDVYSCAYDNYIWKFCPKTEEVY